MRGARVPSPACGRGLGRGRARRPSSGASRHLLPQAGEGDLHETPPRHRPRRLRRAPRRARLFLSLRRQRRPAGARRQARRAGRRRGQPGLKIKAPLIDSVFVYDTRLLLLVPPTEQVIMGDQKRLEVQPYTRYRIVDPLRFYQASRTDEIARAQLTQLVSSSVRRELGQVPLLRLLTPERAADPRGDPQRGGAEGPASRRRNRRSAAFIAPTCRSRPARRSTTA